MVSNIMVHEIRTSRPETTPSRRPSANTQGPTPSENAAASKTGMDRSQVMAALSAIENSTSSLHRSLRFSVDEDGGGTVITVSDRETGEVIRQISPE